MSDSKGGPPRPQPKPTPRNKNPGRNPPEPMERNPEPTPAPTPITIEDVVRWFGISTSETAKMLESHEQFEAARERHEGQLREALRIAKEWYGTYMISGQGMPTPPGYTDGHGKPTPAPPGDSDEASKWAKLQRKVVALETALGATAIRGGELLAENNTLWQDAVDAHVVLAEIVTKLERIPCMSQDCDGPEHHVPDARDGLPNTRCHRCEAVRLAKSVTNGN